MLNAEFKRLFEIMDISKPWVQSRRAVILYEYIQF